MVGRAGAGHLQANVTNAAVVWFYNNADPQSGWRPLGGDTQNARVIPGDSSDAHLAITGAGNFACAIHAVVSDDSGLKGFDVYEGGDHLVVARFKPGMATPGALDSQKSFSSGSWLALDELVYNAANTGPSINAKPSTNDFVFTESGVPAVAWVDAEHNGFAYLSVWPDYPSSLPTDREGFSVAAHAGPSAGAIPPTNSTSPGYSDATGLSIDVYGEAVFVAITDNTSKKAFVSYVDLSDSHAQWQSLATATRDLLPQDQDRAVCSDSLASQTTRDAQNHIKVACNGDILMGHILSKSTAPFGVASLALNGNPLLASSQALPTAPTTCTHGTNQVITNENFEVGEDTSSSWKNGLMSDRTGFGHYLGPLTGAGDIMSKTFAVPHEASSLAFSYDFYNIDGLGSNQVLYVKVDNQRIDFPYMMANSKSGTNGGISWSYTSAGPKFTTQMTIPPSYFSDGFVRIQFDLYHSMISEANLKAGIDKVSLIAACPSIRRVEETTTADERKTEAAGEVGHYYCSAADFPCADDGQSVHVCHYSSRLGYQTFCVPEPDSEVLRFYKNDYCGPCVQGFGGINAE
jgi:hypothetical protein